MTRNTETTHMNITTNNAMCFLLSVATLIVQGVVITLLHANCMETIRMSGYVLFEPVSNFMD